MTAPDWFASPSFWGEVAKLLAQLGGALLIAWLTVRWALGRYKAEKRWERETSALSDLLATLGQLSEVSEEWIGDLARQGEDDEAEDARRSERYKKARRRLDTTLATAAIVLPKEIQAAVEELTAALDKRYTSWDEDLWETNNALGTARKKLVAFGRARMGFRE